MTIGGGARVHAVTGPTVKRTVTDGDVGADAFDANAVQGKRHTDDRMIIEVDGDVVAGDSDAVRVPNTSECARKPNSGGPGDVLRDLTKENVELVAGGDVIVRGVAAHDVVRRLDEQSDITISARVRLDPIVTSPARIGPHVNVGAQTRPNRAVVVARVVDDIAVAGHHRNWRGRHFR